MGVTLSMRMLVVLALISVLLILGIVLVMNISSIANINIPDPNPTENSFSVKVIPNTSSQGTKFFITANSFLEREKQDLYLFVEGQNYSDSLILYDDGEHFDLESYDSVYGGFFDSTNAEIGEYVIKDSENEVLASFIIHKAGCEPIFNSYDNKKVNFVLLPSHYEDYSNFKIDAMNIIGSENSLLGLEPFKSNRDDVSFTLVNATVDLECNVGCNDIPSAICCNRELVFQEASQCSYDGVIVLENTKEFCGLASDYAAVCSKNSVSDLVFSHELGHIFGDLADEYVYEEVFQNFDVSEGYVIDSPNCAPALCDKWSNITNECVQGCTTNTLFRSSEKSIMGSPLFPEFNLVSRFHLINLINEHINIGQRVFKQPVPSSYYVNLNYDEGDVKVNDVFLKPIDSNLISRISEYSVEIKDSQNKLLYRTDIHIPLVEKFVNLSGVQSINTNVDFSLSLPFNPVGSSLEILKNGEIVEKTSLEVFQDSCGNSVCESFENHVSCSLDCSIEDGFCQESECDSDCNSQRFCELEEKAGKIFPFVLAIIVILVIIGIIINFKSGK